jgi:hypothetical protein
MKSNRTSAFEEQRPDHTLLQLRALTIERVRNWRETPEAAQSAGDGRWGRKFRECSCRIRRDKGQVGPAKLVQSRCTIIEKQVTVVVLDAKTGNYLLDFELVTKIWPQATDL